MLEFYRTALLRRREYPALGDGTHAGWRPQPASSRPAALPAYVTRPTPAQFPLPGVLFTPPRG